MLKLIPKEGVRYVFTVHCDEEPIRDVHLFIVGAKLPPEATLQDLDKLEYAGAKRYALRKLAQRSLASAQLRTLLKKYLVSEAAIDRLLEECCQKGYLDDEAWIESFIRGQLSRKCGPATIRQKLLAKGLPSDRIEGALERLDTAEGRSDRLTALLRTRYKNRDLNDFKERQKVVLALLRKGFSFDDINKVLTVTSGLQT